MGDEFCLLTYEEEGVSRAGVLCNGRVHRVSAIFEAERSILDLLASWHDARAKLAAWASAGPSGGRRAADVRLLAPTQYLTNFFCVGANYWDHLSEMAVFIERTTGKAPSTEKAAEPWFFVSTTRGTIVGDNARVRLPAFSRQVDWEVHSIAEQIAYLSRHVTLYPSDVIATGTPAGVGLPRNDFLLPGDQVRAEIAGLGVLTTTMVAS